MDYSDCIECLTHIAQWTDLADENDQLKKAVQAANKAQSRLRRKFNRLKRKFALANQLIEQQDILLTILAQIYREINRSNRDESMPLT